MGRLSGKVAVITGASVGIGHACAELMLREGAAVAALDRVPLPAQDSLLAFDHAAFAFWRCDVSREDEVATAINAVARHFGRIDILVNNAGIAGVSKPTHELTSEEWDAVQAVNVKGVFFCTKHVIPHMRCAGGGSIINLSSIYGIVGAADVPAYHASKGAVRLMTKTDALIYASDKIRVNSIHPGFIRTPMVDAYIASGADPAATLKAVEALHPLGGLGAPEDVAWGAVYLASDEARFVTGSELTIDGGYTAR